MNSYSAIRPRSSNPTDGETMQLQSQPAESSVSVGKGRKRKAPVHVSQNACNNCKKARSKCDGIEGQTCTRCNSRGLKDSCQYELHVKTAKEELVRKIRNLEGTIEQMQTELKEKDLWIQSITELFDPGTKGAAILQQLQNEGPPYLALIGALSNRPQVTRNHSASSAGPLETDSEDVMDTDDDNPSRWTSVTQDDQKIHHLMALYFAWVHPVHMFFSERHFMDSFKACDRRYCSPALVNAICALGCRYASESNGSDVAITRLGERFSRQVWIDLRMEKRMTPVSSVTYAIMFLVQLSAGQAREAVSHLQYAVETLRKVDRGYWSEDAFQITFFGIHAVNINWATLTYQKPPALVSHYPTVFYNVELDRPDSSWRNYKSEKDASQKEIRARGIETAQAFARLSLINLDALTAWSGSTGKITTRALLDLYQKYLFWRDELSEALGANLEDRKEDETLPYIHILHINYCVALCHLFSPLLECPDLSKQGKMHIQGILVRSAQKGLNIYERFTKSFSSRYQSPLQAYYLVHLADVILRQDRQNADRVINFCLGQLGEALSGFPVNGPLQAMFCESVIACRQSLPVNVEVLMGGRTWQSYSREEKLDCTERLTYAQPVDLLAMTIDASLAETFKEEWDQFIESHGGQDSEEEAEGRRLSNGSETRSSNPRAIDINSLMNP